MIKNYTSFDIEQEVSNRSYLSTNSLNHSEFIIAGVDEAGRGPLCGPVVAGAVIFTSFNLPPPIKITDSKQMTASQRATAYDWIINNTVWAVGSCSPEEIDQINILWASMLAMKRAIAGLSKQPDFCLVDGNRLPDNIFSDAVGGNNIILEPAASINEKMIMGRAVVKGDARSWSIAAASIIAKETRDKIMRDMAGEFPQYGWDKNAGYPTAAHLQAIEKYGINRHYRKTFRPIKERIQNETT